MPRTIRFHRDENCHRAIADGLRRLVTILVRDGDDWSGREVKGQRSAASVVLPGFVVPLADLWSGADR